MNGTHPWFPPLPVGVANLATRRQMELSRTLNGGSSRLLPLGFPRGEAVATKQRHFGTDVFVVTDEGWRWLKVSDFSGERWKPERTPFIQLHSLTNLSPPLISLFYQTVPKCRLIKNPASPRGKPRTQKILVAIIQRSTLLHWLRAAKLATPTMGAAKLRACAIQRSTRPVRH